MKNRRTISPEQAMKQMQEIFEKRGKKALATARKEVLDEPVECKEAREALDYFMNEYWHDTSRASLLSLTCEAAGGNPELTTPIAVSMILISGAIDIHDDIIDQSKTKGDRLTVYGKFGKEIALLTGDALLFKGLTLLNKIKESEVPREKMAIIVDIVKDMFFELGDAEAMELSMRGLTDISPETYIQVVHKKAADVEAHTHISAILADASQRKIQALRKFGRLLGMLIILRDDWIDVLDHRENLNRVKRECLPLPVLYALQNPGVKARLISVLRQKELSQKHVEIIIEEVEKAGGFDEQSKLMQRLAQEAISRLKILEYPFRRKLELLITATLLPYPKHKKRKLVSTTTS